jgi:hypothetical protein
MLRPDALSSSQQPDGENMAEELYPDFFPQPLSPITNLPPEAPIKDLSFSAQFEVETSSIQTDQLDFPSAQIDISTGIFAPARIQPRTEQLVPSTGALDIPATQSLVAALQATIKAKQVVRQPIVIPGQKRSRRDAGRMTTSERRLPPHLRLLVTLSSLLGILLISLFALAPLSSSDSNIPFIKSLTGWTQTQEINWSTFTAHILGNNQPQTANTHPANVPAVPPVAVLSTSQYVSIAQQDAVASGIPPVYFTRQIMLESGFNPNAVSPSGAVGIAQFEPSTAAGLGFNPYDPIAALKGAANYMARLSAEYGGDYTKALAAYNAGTGTVNSAIQRGGANWLSLMPAETQYYVARITGA